MVLVGVVAAGIALAVSRSPHRVGASNTQLPGKARGARGSGAPRVPSTPTTVPAPTTTTAPSTHGPITSPPLPAPALGFAEGQVTAVGDSVMLDYQTPLQQAVPGINVEAAVSRQWSDGETILQQLKAAGQLGAVVIVGLGTNGPITDADFDAMMTTLSGASRVVFVTVHVDRPWQDPNNGVLAAGVRRYPRAVLADWNTLATQNPSWVYSDGTHLPIDGQGAQALATLIAQKA